MAYHDDRKLAKLQLFWGFLIGSEIKTASVGNHQTEYDRSHRVSVAKNASYVISQMCGICH